jgi:putative FmdB family regulatory protein
MPIYAYRCEACGHAKDVLQKISDAPLTTCPACGAEAFAKQVTAAGFQLKGSGWYATDFRGGAQAKTEPKDGAKPANEPAKPADAGAKAPDGDGKKGGTDKSGGGSAGSSSGGSSGGSSSGGGDSGSSSSGGLSASGSCGTSCGCH